MKRSQGKQRSSRKLVAVPSASAVDECRRCDLWRRATHGVPGLGSVPARIMLVGEQPGSEEDLKGLPFVGPAGRLLDRALERAGIDRAGVFVTNAVKHFKWEPRGKRRLHRKPDAREIGACNYWLDLEIARVKPAIVVALGTTALSALGRKGMTITAARTQALEHDSGAKLFATYHPSAVLRARPDSRDDMFATLWRDLKRAAAVLED